MPLFASQGSSVACMSRRQAHGEAIRAIRVAKGLTLADVATTAGVGVGYLSRIERGQRHPYAATIQAIADALDVSVAAITTTGTRAA